MKLTPPQRRGLEILAEQEGPIAPRDFARLMWPDSKGWNRRTRGRDNHPGAMGGTMPMIGARLLWSLFDSRLASPDCGRWRITVSGIQRLTEPS